MPDVALKALGDVPRNLDKRLWDFLNLVKHNFQVLEGLKGTLDNKGVTFADLAEALAELPDAQAEDLIHKTPRNYSEEIEELSNKINSFTPAKSYDTEIEELLNKIYSLPPVKTYDNEIEELHAKIELLQPQKDWGDKIDDLEAEIRTKIAPRAWSVGGIPTVLVADITNPTEISSVVSTQGLLIKAIQVVGGSDDDILTFYVWDDDPGGADSPWVVGNWVAAGGAYHNGDAHFNGIITLNDNLVLPKTAGKGIQIDPANPSFGWRDLEGDVDPKATGAGKATLGVWRGGLSKAWFYDTGDTLDQLKYHIPHDYVPGSDLHIHIHWGHHGTAISGSLVVTFGATYAKGFNRGDFPAEVAPVITVATPNIATVPQYRHRVDEIQLSAAAPSATQIDTDDIEPDGVIMMGLVITTIPTITGGVVDKPAFFEVDIHYQSTDIATKQRAPNFYV